MKGPGLSMNKARVMPTFHIVHLKLARSVGPELHTLSGLTCRPRRLLTHQRSGPSGPSGPVLRLLTDEVLQVMGQVDLIALAPSPLAMTKQGD